MTDANPAVPLYSYQLGWIGDQSRFKIGMWSRQVGKTFAATLEIVRDVMTARAEGRASPWLILSRGDRQAREAMRSGIQTHARVFGLALKERSWDVHVDGQNFRANEWDAGGGNVVTALPANPDTARGYSRNVYLDEFAIHKDSREIWGALFPVITKGWKIRITSTPRGKSGKFYELMTAGDELWSRHVVDIHRAIAGGLPVDAEELRAGLADEDLWKQEYLCEWLDEASAWLPYDLIDSCESSKAGRPELYQGGRSYIGNDIGRQKHLWCAWAAEMIGDVAWTREIKILKGQPFKVQDTALDGMVGRYRPVRVAIDATGMGAKPAEDAADRYGKSLVEGVTFTPAAKLYMATALKDRFEDRTIRIPAGDALLRADLHSVKKIVGPTGQVRLLADENLDGHADRFWAAALMAGAAATGTREYAYETGREDYLDTPGRHHPRKRRDPDDPDLDTLTGDDKWADMTGRLGGGGLFG